MSVSGSCEPAENEKPGYVADTPALVLAVYFT